MKRWDLRVVMNWTMAFVFVGAGIALAADTKDAAAAGFNWNAIWQGAVQGVIATLIMWVKSPGSGKFDIRGLAVKLPVGIIVGAVAGFRGQSFDDTMIWATNIGIIVVVDALVKAVLRRLPGAWGWEVTSVDPPTPRGK